MKVIHISKMLCIDMLHIFATVGEAVSVTLFPDTGQNLTFVLKLDHSIIFSGTLGALILASFTNFHL